MARAKANDPDGSPKAEATAAGRAVAKKKTTKEEVTPSSSRTSAAAARATAGTRTKSKSSPRQTIRCYLCGAAFEVSAKTMSTTCTKCHKAIKVEDLKVKSYVPVNELQTCGRIRITRRGRVAARVIQSGRGVVCEGAIEGAIETDGGVELGPKAAWKGKLLLSRTLAVSEGATLEGRVLVPWEREE